MGDYGIKISKSGVDVKTATEDNLTLTTKYSMLKVIKVGTFSYTFSSNPGVGCQTLGSVIHGFDYIPAHDSFYNYDGGTEYSKIPKVILNGDFPLGVYTEYIWTTYCDVTNLVFRFCRIDNSGGNPLDLNGKNIIFKYYIFADPGA